jgi:thiopeptide-type bacteriocin biosynthesis protein
VDGNVSTGSTAKVLNDNAAFTHVGFCLLRTPLLPIEALNQVSDGNWNSLLQDSAVAESLVIASPAFAERIGPGLALGYRERLSLVRYLTRMATRPTPFGLFAGVTYCTISGDATKLSLAPRAEYRRHARLDCDLASRLVQVANSAEWRINDSVYRIGGAYRYVDVQTSGSGERTFRLATAEADAALDHVMHSLQQLSLPLDQLRARLAEVIDAPADDLNAYIAELQEAQILVCAKGVRTTGGGLDEQVLTGATAQEPSSSAERLAKAVSAIDGTTLSTAVSYSDIFELSEAAGGDRQRTIQVDLQKPSRIANVSTSLTAEVLSTAVALHRILGTNPLNKELRVFAEAFERAYGADEVPLTLALDDEMGVGLQGATDYSSVPEPLLVRYPAAERDISRSEWLEADAYLLSKLEDVWRTGNRPLALEEEDIQRLQRGPILPLPSSFAAVVSLHGDVVEFKAASGPPATKMLSRFAHLDPRLATGIIETSARDASWFPDAIVAEVVHLPGGRTGNVLIRPQLLKFEIPYLGEPAVGKEFQLPINDLQLSLRNGRFCLRSRRMNKEIIPRFQTALNFWSPANLAVFKFLGLLQAQESASGIRWSWGALSSAKDLPRVTVGKCVVAKRRWLIRPDDVRTISHVTDHNERAARFNAWRTSRGVDRYCHLVDGDDDLVVDLESDSYITEVLHRLRRNERVVLAERLVGDAAVTSPEGSFENEIIVPYVKSSHSDSVRPLNATWHRTVSAAVDQTWVYAKLYAGPQTCERVLLGVKDFIASKRAGRGLSKWFFIRYGDPDWHIRLRLYSDAAGLREDVLTFADRLLSEGQVQRYALENYFPERTRYGGNEAIAEVETIFAADSDAVLDTIELLLGSDGELRWRAALMGLDALVKSFGFHGKEAEDLVLNRARAFESEQGGPAIRDFINRRVRENRLVATDLVRGNVGEELLPFAKIWRRRSQVIVQAVAALRDHETAGRLTESLASICGSIMHMHVNRLFRSAHRSQETILYAILASAYQAARLSGERRS